MEKEAKIEWKTLGVMVFCYLLWGLGTTLVYNVSPVLGFIIITLMISLHSSLQHEVLHGHPLPNQKLSELLVYPAIGLLIPYERFKDTHLKHHYDPNLTDPYEDPESNYLDPKVWNKISKVIQGILLINNSLLGRIILGPLISMVVFIRGDIRDYLLGQKRILISWLHHVLGVFLVCLWLVSFSQIPLIVYFICAYFGLGLLKIRTFLEHRAHEHPRGRTVIINDRGFFSFLFLNNNFHLVHHMHPNISWYELPRIFDRDKEKFLQRNEGYSYTSYFDIFKKYAFQRKDPVPHPLWKENSEK